MKKTQVSIQFDPCVLSQARAMAKKEERSLAQMVTILVREALLDRKKLLNGE